MNKVNLFSAGHSDALAAATQYLKSRGISVKEEADGSITHLLLPVPSFDPVGSIRGGCRPEDILAGLPKEIVIIGGNLKHPALAGYETVDLLADPLYTAENAHLTADCAIRVAAEKLLVCFRGCPILVIGWGRIGKCLAAMLMQLDADVTVSARKAEDLALLSALGYGTENTATLGPGLLRYRVIFNTVPAEVISPVQAGHCEKDCLLIDLASSQGICCPEAIWARGLPGKMVPESSGKLIGRTVIRQLYGKESIK